MNNCMPKMDNIEEMDKFRKIYDLPRLNHEEIKSLNRALSRKTLNQQ